ncbi:biotin/lipoyl-containing protein [Pseudomonas sivasensis]|uniref:biotin/lipoyl-containing protein n=1 Tax=Pseudomonas sivasensis TaxID=1880678 RepID=UPI000F066439|nr:biotin/lipoyl-containing protein [Pseudomonas sivasensis]
MTLEEIRQLALWLKEHHLVGAEVSRPGVHLTLKRGAPAVSVVTPVAAAAVDDKVLRTTGLGRLLLTHPQQNQPFVAVGDQLSAGQLVAVLQVGELLLPQRSPKAAKVVDIRVPCGTTVGYGEAFLGLEYPV